MLLIKIWEIPLGIKETASANQVKVLIDFSVIFISDIVAAV